MTQFHASLVPRKTRELNGITPETIPWEELVEAGEPVLLKGLVKKWGLVEASQHSPLAAMDYLKSFYAGLNVGSFWADSTIRGRYTYTDDFSGFNFEKKRVPLTDVLDSIAQHLEDDNPPGRYVGSTTIDACLPGFRQDNDLSFNHPMFADNDPLASIWLGNPSVISAHYDSPNNLACCVTGMRRFTLFPPEQVDNLYPGPLEPTPGGQAISLVDLNNPDFERFPKVRHALEAGQVADMEAGDALFYPSMWWHQVEGIDRFNVMINYWWNTVPAFMGTPANVLKHAILSLRDRPLNERKAWQALFDYYIFGDAESNRSHIPPEAQGELAPLDDKTARQLRAWLIQRLNR
ncbi:cupin-like domain-containing protein [Gilvimarinus sp. 1_MG-2023]|uniref:cupin-like domain-containing protein n=1 Tax=Gilvimarinus sp. 1_MG-2023 TaxID=3062638 RepID=UPI0026E1B8B2|nr:cupin-like domain-containing protein [Gilvimarinus sp. 1_MG-2023]MDO6746133.1 cupin-like domain-containing protein [Gilvimarinus sp. 1_MG-2023]